MLGGERRTELISNTLEKPSFGQTFSGSFEKPLLQVDQLAFHVFPGLSSEQTKKETADRISLIDELQSNPLQGFGQKASNAVGEFIGGLLPTLPFIAGGEVVGGAAAGVIGFGARKVALEAAAEYGSEGLLTAYTAAQVPLNKLATGSLARYLPGWSLGTIGTELATQYAAYKGLIIPEHFAENYNAVNDTLDLNHAINEWTSDNYGFLLGGAPLAAGYVAYKGVRAVLNLRKSHLTTKAIEAEHERLLAEHKEILKQNEIKAGEQAIKEAKVSELQEHLAQAVNEGHITQKEHDWYLDYLENPNHPDIHEAGLEILKDLQIPYDRVTGRVWHQIFNREDITNLQSGLFDQAITNFSKEENELLSGYIIHNAMDGYVSNMLENPNLLDAIKGMTHNLGLKIAEHKLTLNKFDETLTKELSKRLTKKTIFSQKNIYTHLKDIGVRDVREVPYHVPRAVRKKLRLLERIEKIKSKSTRKLEREFNDGTLVKLKNELNLMKTLSPNEELNYLKDSLMPNGKLRNNYKGKNAYYRLEELSQVWPEARHVLNRIEMEAFNVKQQALNEVLKKFTDMVDANASRLANPDNVKRYLNSRIERSVPQVSRFNNDRIDFERRKAEIETIEPQTFNPEILYDESSFERVKTTEFDDAKIRFEESERKFKQFRENESALSELIKCALGG